jgi:hypothetical protein
MFDCVIAIVTSKWFIINWLLGIISVEYALHKNKVLRKVDENRDSKFPAYRRTDVHLWWRPLLYLGCWMTLPKLILLGGFLPILGTYIRVVLIGNKKGTHFKKW